MRSAYASADTREMHWSYYGRCRATPDLWSSANHDVRARAAHNCRAHCPVLRECTEELATVPAALLHGVVMAGIDHTPSAGIARWISTDYVACDACQKKASQKSGLRHKQPLSSRTLSR